MRAARRPTPTPKPVTCPGQQVPCGTGCCCPAGTSGCGSDCCPNGQAECCDGACCFGACYGEELCCGAGNPVCSVDGCCSGVCVNQGQHCCRPAAACGDTCCSDTERCCTSGSGVLVCLPAGGCCTDAECLSGLCQNGLCIPRTPTSQPTATHTTVPTQTTAPTQTRVPTETPIPSSTSTNTAENTATSIPTETSTPTETPTSTATESPTETQTASPTPTQPAPGAQLHVQFSPNEDGETCALDAQITGGPSSELIGWVLISDDTDAIEQGLHNFSGFTDDSGRATLDLTAAQSGIPFPSVFRPGFRLHIETSLSANLFDGPVDCGLPWAAPTHTTAPTQTPTGTATETGTPTGSATIAVPAMTALLLNLVDRCLVFLDLSGFPPNDLVNLSMLARANGMVSRFLDDQFYNDLPVDQHGNLEFSMTNVWVEHEPFVTITVCPIAVSQSTGATVSAGCMILPESCDPFD